MAGAQGIAAAATRMRRLPRAFATMVALAFALLVVTGAQGGADRAGQTEVTVEVVVPFGTEGPAGTVVVNPGEHTCAQAFDPCEIPYSAPTRVELAANPNPGYEFYDWTTAECQSGNKCELDLTGEDAEVSVFPLFDPAVITVVVAGPGKVTWPPNGVCPNGIQLTCETDPLPAASEVTFTAESANSIHWSFGCEPINETQCTARPGNRIVGVGFDNEAPNRPFDVQAWLRVSRTGSGSGRITGPDGFDCGADCREELDFAKLVTLEAEPAAGSRFDRWIGVCGSNPTCRFNVGPVTSVQARFVAAPPPPPPPSPPQSPPPPKLETRITKLTAFRRAGRWRVTARIVANKPVSAHARVGRGRRTWGDRRVNLRAGSSSLTLLLARRARRGKCWFSLVARTAGGEVLILPRRTVKLGR